MNELFNVNNKIIYNINTTILYTSSFNYTDDAIYYLNNNCIVITKDRGMDTFEIPNDIFEIIKTHYNKLHLLERFSANINEVITSLENTIISFVGKLPLDEIRDSIIEKSNRDKIAFGHNYWKSVLEIELANCVEYMNRFVTIG